MAKVDEERMGTMPPEEPHSVRSDDVGSPGPKTGPKKEKSPKGDRYPNTQEWTEYEREAYLKANEALIHSIVNAIQNIPDPALSPEDLYQEARLAFWRAFDTYNPARRTLFTTYVHKIMRNAINEVLRSANATKRRPPTPPVPYDSGRDEYGEEVVGADNMEVSESSLVNQLPSIDEMCARKEVVEYIHKLLKTKFSPDERRVFLNLSQGHKTQIELAREMHCSQAKISMMYTFVKIRLHYELREAGF